MELVPLTVVETGLVFVKTTLMDLIVRAALLASWETTVILVNVYNYMAQFTLFVFITVTLYTLLHN